jgi:hypothetical protein
MRWADQVPEPTLPVRRTNRELVHNERHKPLCDEHTHQC